VSVTVSIGTRTVVHKGSGGVTTAFPDVCKTPSPGGPVPVPYPNIARSADTAKGAKSVKVDGNPVAVKDSEFSMSTGDEAGSAGGVVTSKIKGKARFLNYDFNVKIEGKNVPRMGDQMGQNESSPPNPPPGTLIQKPQGGAYGLGTCDPKLECATKDPPPTADEIRQELKDKGYEPKSVTNDCNEAWVHPDKGTCVRIDKLGNPTGNEGYAGNPPHMHIEEKYTSEYDETTRCCDANGDIMETRKYGDADFEDWNKKKHIPITNDQPDAVKKFNETVRYKDMTVNGFPGNLTCPDPGLVDSAGNAVQRTFRDGVAPGPDFTIGLPWP